MTYAFGTYALDPESLELTNGGEVVEVEPQVFSLLVCLIENRDRVVSKDELIEMVWDGRIVSDGTLNTRINAARKAVGDDGKSQAVIKTFPRRGFRWVAEVGEEDSASINPVSIADKPSIAVLPFENLSNDPEQEFFSDGIAEDIITALSRLRWLSVIARNTTFTYKGQAVDVQMVAQDLGVRYVLEGSIRKAGNRVRISAQLVEGDTGNHLWAQRFDRELEDIFAVQDEITETVAGTVQSEVNLTEQRRVKAKPPESLDAWENYQHGISYLNERTLKSFTAARAFFERAIELDPNFVLGYTGYVEAAFDRIGLEDRTHWDRAQLYARKALELDPHESRAHTAMGICYTNNDDFSAAVSAFETAIDLNPSDANIRLLMGTTLLQCGRAAESIPHFHLAIHQSPRDAEIGRFHARLGLAHLCLKEFEAAIEWARKAVPYPNAPWAHSFLLSALAHLGDRAEAKRVMVEALDRRSELSLSLMEKSRIVPFIEYREILFEGLRKAGLPEE